MSLLHENNVKMSFSMKIQGVAFNDIYWRVYGILKIIIDFWYICILMKLISQENDDWKMIVSRIVLWSVFFCLFFANKKVAQICSTDRELDVQ